MTITRADVADLREGDVVEVEHAAWPEGSVIRGALYQQECATRLHCCGFEVATADGEVYQPSFWRRFTVVSRAPRPLYVNHPRTEPVPGDVVRCADHEDCDETWCYAPIQAAPNSPWQSTRHAGRASWDDLFDRTLLLVDGTTGLPPAVQS